MENITFIEGIRVCVVAMAIVFIILILILAILNMFKYIGENSSTAQEIKQPFRTVNKLDLNDENMVVAGLIATIEASNECGNELKIVNIREVGEIK
ncbi:MAG: OadG family transporter subunit [Bacilli bacterium]